MDEIMDKLNSIDDLKAEFDKFVLDKCRIDEMSQDEQLAAEEEEEEIPNYAEAITQTLLAPARCGVNLTRWDVKRIGDEVDASLPIKERKRMYSALFRHIRTKDELEGISHALNKHLDGRVLMYEDLSLKFPSSKPIFDEHLKKIDKVKVMFRRVIEDFEEFDPDAMPVEM
jgi:hypothetical protein